MKKLSIFSCIIFFCFCMSASADSGNTSMADDTAKNKGTNDTKTNNSNKNTTTSDAQGSTKSGVCYYEWKVDNDTYVVELVFSKKGNSYKDFFASRIAAKNKTANKNIKISNSGETFTSYNIVTKWKPFKEGQITDGTSCYTSALSKKPGSYCSGITWNCPQKICNKKTGDNSFALEPYTNNSCPSGFHSGSWSSEYKVSDDAENVYGKDDDWDKTEDEKGLGANIDSIIDWGKNPNNKYEYADNVDCEALMNDYEEGQKIIDFLNNLFWILSIIGIVLLLIMTAIEFIKVITGQDDAGIKNAFKHTVIRAICVIILLLLPVIIDAILNIINQNSSGVQIGAKGQVMCGIGE